MEVLVSEHISYPPVNAQLRDCNSSVWHGMKEEKKRDWSSLIPRPLPDFISQPWRKIGSCEIKSGRGLGTRLLS